MSAYAEVLNNSLSHARATGTVAGKPADFIAVHRQENDTAATANMTMTVPMSLEDITAVLWFLVSDGYLIDDLHDDSPDGVHALVLETALATGMSRLETARQEMGAFPAGSEEHDSVTQLRSLVASLYGPAKRACRATRTKSARRELAGVSA